MYVCITSIERKAQEEERKKNKLRIKTDGYEKKKRIGCVQSC